MRLRRGPRESRKIPAHSEVVPTPNDQTNIVRMLTRLLTIISLATPGCHPKAELIPSIPLVVNPSNQDQEPGEPSIQVMVEEIMQALDNPGHYKPREKRAGYNLGKDRVRRYLDDHERRRVHKYNSLITSPESVDRLPLIVGMDRFKPELPANYLKEDFDEYFKTGFPRGWITPYNAKSLNFNPQLIYIKGYPGLEKSLYEARFLVSDNGTSSEIEILSSKLLTDPELTLLNTLKDTLLHELAHANDYSESPDLTEEQSIRLMYRILKITQHPDRPKYGYVEKIQSVEENKAGDVNMCRMKELFAMTMAAALDHCPSEIKTWEEWADSFAGVLVEKYRASPEIASKLAKIVRKLIESTNPEFKIWEKCTPREEVRNRIMRKFRYHFYAYASEMSPDQDLGKILKVGLKENPANNLDPKIEPPPVLKPKPLYAKEGESETPTMAEELDIEQKAILETWLKLLERYAKVKKDFFQNQSNAQHGEPADIVLRTICQEMDKLLPAQKSQLKAAMLQAAEKKLLPGK